MSIQGNIKKILFATLWSVVGAGMLVLLIAAIKKKNSKICAGYKIQIYSSPEHSFVDEKEVLSLLTDHGVENLTGETITSINLRKKEQRVRMNAWIRDAQLFFDNNDILRVNLVEREPVGRIFTTSGTSFYIDSSGLQLPVPDKLPAKVPVFTSFPAGKWRANGADSSLGLQIKRLACYISNHPFWRAQIEQVNINPDRTFEMIPAVGNHRIIFGDGRDYEQKFHRVFLFYKEVMTRTGFERYTKINVAYAGQIVGTRRENGITKIDSLKAIRSIETLMRSAQRIQADTPRQQHVQPLEHDQITEQNLRNYDLVPESNDSLGKGGKKIRTEGSKPIIDPKRLNNQK